jgi:hypothetical protein
MLTIDSLFSVDSSCDRKSEPLEGLDEELGGDGVVLGDQDVAAFEVLRK